MKRIKWVKWFEIFLTFSLIFAPFVVSAQIDFKLPGVGGNGWGPSIHTIPEFVRWVINMLLSLAGLVALLFIIIGGFRYITSAGNEEAAEAGRKTFVNAIIGLVIIGLSWAIVNVVINTISGPGGLN